MDKNIEAKPQVKKITETVEFFRQASTVDQKLIELQQQQQIILQKQLLQLEEQTKNVSKKKKKKRVYKSKKGKKSKKSKKGLHSTNNLLDDSQQIQGNQGYYQLNSVANANSNRPLNDEEFDHTKLYDKINDKGNRKYNTSLNTQTKNDFIHSEVNKEKQGVDDITEAELIKEMNAPFEKYYWTVFILLLNFIWVQAFLPVRMSFENQRKIMLTIAVTDLAIDVLFTLESISNFFIPGTNKDGEYVFKRKKVAKQYLKSWFILDCLGNIPYGMFKAFPGEPSLDDMSNFVKFNFAYIPRFYIVCLALKLFRIRTTQKYLVNFLKRRSVGVEAINLIITVWTLILILHMIACFWGVAGSFNLATNQNWIYKLAMQDEDVIYKYITSLYWASVTIITVGYGDILPQNFWEKTLVCIIFIIGVAMFSYTLSALANQFSELSKGNSKRQNRDSQIAQLEQNYKLPRHLAEKITFFFAQSETIISISKDYEINTILKFLPPSLKTRLALFLYHDAIAAIPFLQNRSQIFYLNFLSELIPMKFQRNTVILKQGTRPEEVFFILKGVVINPGSQRTMSAGSMIGETDYIYKRERVDSFIAGTDVYILKFELEVFKIILDQFPDIKSEIESIAKKREKLRLMIHQKDQLLEDQEQHKLEIMSVLQKILKKEQKELVQQQYLGNALARKLDNSGIIVSNDALLNIKLQQMNERSSSTDNLLQNKRDSSLENITKGIKHDKNRKSSLEKIEENKSEIDEDMSMRKTKSNFSNDNIFKQQENYQASPRNRNTFKIEQIKERMRKLSSKKITNQPSGQKKKYQTNMFINSQSEEQIDVVNQSSNAGSSTARRRKLADVETARQSNVFKSDITDDKASHNFSPEVYQRVIPNVKPLSVMTQGISKMTTDIEKPNIPQQDTLKPPENPKKLERKRSSSLNITGKFNDADMFYQSQGKEKNFLQSQDAFLYSNPAMKNQMLKSKIFNSLQSFENPERRIEKIIMIIKKSKLILNEYGILFAEYLEKLRNNSKNTVSEHIILPTKNAIMGIKKYIQIISCLESKLEQPKMILDYIDQLENILQPQLEFQQKLRSTLDKLYYNQQRKNRQVSQNLTSQIQHTEFQLQQQQIISPAYIQATKEKKHSYSRKKSSQKMNMIDLETSYRINDYNEMIALKQDISSYQNSPQNSILIQNNLKTFKSPSPNSPSQNPLVQNQQTNNRLSTNMLSNIQNDYYGSLKKNPELTLSDQKNVSSRQAKQNDGGLPFNLNLVTVNSRQNSDQYQQQQDQPPYQNYLETNNYNNQYLNLNFPSYRNNHIPTFNQSVQQQNPSLLSSSNFQLDNRSYHQQQNQIQLQYKPSKQQDMQRIRDLIQKNGLGREYRGPPDQYIQTHKKLDAGKLMAQMTSHIFFLQF
ncbi:UNKNOWN [Stylonychia lemnae]|uniref:Cyclic nucleotide-binding domain-containing protein n=1 Tax=Stylonychia lemnae TaxID=5949 RepID=A0A078A9K5_STYLE|nr:UNKNOWN [Stylonychia lemnae]|eukprot:CDW78950.1 UNKNOWN [Stylonychia lemnae]